MSLIKLQVMRYQMTLNFAKKKKCSSCNLIDKNEKQLEFIKGLKLFR